MKKDFEIKKLKTEEFDIVYKFNEKEYGLASVWNGAQIEPREPDMRIQNFREKFGMLEVLEEKYFEEFLNGKNYITEIKTSKEALQTFVEFWGLDDKILKEIIIVKSIQESIERLTEGNIALIERN